MSRRRGTHGYVRGRTRGTSYGTLKGIRRGIGWEQHCGGPATSPVPTSYVEAGRRDPSCRAAGRRGVTAFGVRARRAQACHRGRMDRVDPETASGERTTLEQFLDYQRATLLHKTTGLSHAQMNYQLPTSALSLAGLLKHLALVEDDWIQVRFFGRPEFEPWASAPWDENRDWESTPQSKTTRTSFDPSTALPATAARRPPRPQGWTNCRSGRLARVSTGTCAGS